MIYWNNVRCVFCCYDFCYLCDSKDVVFFNFMFYNGFVNFFVNKYVWMSCCDVVCNRFFVNIDYVGMVLIIKMCKRRYWCFYFFLVNFVVW